MFLCKPLAIRIAGARLAARPAWPVSELARRLGDATRRLEELTVDELGVRAAFHVSFTALQESADPIDQAAAHVFGLLSVPDSPDLDVPATARLLDQSEPTSQTLLERLVDAQLLETPRPGRYGFHDLVRLHARQHAATQAKPEQLAALERLFGFYTATAWRSLALLRPGDQRVTAADSRWTIDGMQFPDTAAALGWLEAERANLLAAISQIATLTPAMPPKLATDLAGALFGFFDVHNHWADWVQANQTALGLARQTADRRSQARAHNDLSLVHMRLGRYPEAIDHQQRALALFQELGDRQGEALSFGYLGRVYGRLGRYPEAIDHQQRALALFQELGDRHGQASSLGNLAVVNFRLGRYAEALDSQQRALAFFQELGDRQSQAWSLRNLGLVYERLGRYPEALDHHQQAHTIRREFSDRRGQANSLTSLGLVYERLGRYPEALDHHQQGLSLYRELGHRHGQAHCLNNLGVVYVRLGHYLEAIDCQQRALAFFQELGDRYGQAETLWNLGDALLGAGRHRQAREAWQEALEFCKALQLPEADGVRSRLAALPVEVAQQEGTRGQYQT